MRLTQSQAVFTLTLALLLAACSSAPSATATMLPPTPTDGPAPETLNFNYTVHSSRSAPALERLTGLSWEGGYIWTPFVVYESENFHLFYSGYKSEARGVGHASSSEGTSFVRSGDEPVLDFEEDGRELFSPVVYLDEDGSWVMYIVNDERRTGLAGDRVMRYMADSPQGPWTISNGGEPVYEAPSEDHWTHEIVIRSVVVEAGQILLGFDARHDDTISIGILRSENGLDFELLADEPVLTKGESDSWEEDAVSAPIIFATEDGYEMFYMGFVKNSAGRFASFEGHNLWLGYATSADGITWEKYSHNPVMNIPEEQGTAYISGMKVDDTYYIYYVYGQGAYGIGAATLTIEPIE